jgi:hypothetical protein
MLLQHRADVIVLAENELEHGVPVATGDLLLAQILEHRLAVNEPETRPPQRSGLAGTTRLHGHRTHQHIVLGFPTSIEPRVFEDASYDERLRRRPLAGDVRNSRFRLFHEPDVGDSLRSHGPAPAFDSRITLAGDVAVFSERYTRRARQSRDDSPKSCARDFRVAPKLVLAVLERRRAP